MLVSILIILQEINIGNFILSFDDHLTLFRWSMWPHTHTWAAKNINIRQVVLILCQSSSVYQDRTHYGSDTKRAALDSLHSLLYLLHYTGDEDHFLLSSEMEGRHYSSWAGHRTLIASKVFLKRNRCNVSYCISQPFQIKVFKFQPLRGETCFLYSLLSVRLRRIW